MRWLCVFEMALMMLLGFCYKDPLYFIALGVFLIAYEIGEWGENAVKAMAGAVILTNAVNKDKNVQK